MRFVKPKYIQLIHIAKQQLKLDEDTYRLMLVNLTGKDSTKKMKIAELDDVLKHLEKSGFILKANKFKNQTRPKSVKSKEIYLKKITALLMTQQKPQSYADAISKKAFGIDFVHWLEVWQLKKVIQMLSVYNKRKAV